MESDPFAVLGLAAATATERDVRAARRRLAKKIHPDQGGDSARMTELNRAFERALDLVRRPKVEAETGEVVVKPRRPRPGRFVERDDASFTVSVLPVHAFEVLVDIANQIGRVLVDDPPYLLECYLYEPVECFCRLELFPEADGSQVAVTVVAAEGASTPPPSADDVRDAFIARFSRG